jgi:hypothetical protein
MLERMARSTWRLKVGEEGPIDHYTTNLLPKRRAPWWLSLCVAFFRSL